MRAPGRPRSRLSPRAGLAVSIAACLVASLGLIACATTQKQAYVDWIAVSNPGAICKDMPDCVQHSTWRGKPLCTIVTADKDVSYARLGQQVRECLL